MILKNLKSLIRRYPVAVVLNFTGLVAAFVAFALIFLQADYELSFNLSWLQLLCSARLSVVAAV